ncbi:MAG TPA: hypothetical protein P5072_03070, partial [Parvularculaceae bacterium]|nr:hypothetical protein [Parvularculaceae bacterium]
LFPFGTSRAARAATARTACALACFTGLASRFRLAFAILGIAAGLVIASRFAIAAFWITAFGAVLLRALRLTLLAIFLTALVTGRCFAGLVIPALGVTMISAIAVRTLMRVADRGLIAICVRRLNMRLRLHGADDAEIVFCVLEIVFRFHSVARRSRVARERQILVVNLVGGSTDAHIRSIGVKSAINVHALAAALIAPTLHRITLVLVHKLCKFPFSAGQSKPAPAPPRFDRLIETGRKDINCLFSDQLSLSRRFNSSSRSRPLLAMIHETAPCSFDLACAIGLRRRA